MSGIFDQTQSGKLDPEQVESERKHLEGLLKDRINYFMVFASVVVIGVPNIINEKVRVVALLAWTTASFLMSFAILRTHRLVTEALEEIKKHYPHHPYKVWSAKIKFPGNANTLLVLVPFVLSIVFAGITIYYFCTLGLHQ